MSSEVDNLGLNAGSFSETISISDIVYFDVKETDFTPGELADHLRGLEHLAMRLPRLLENLFPDAKLNITCENLFIEGMKNGSLVEDIRAIMQIMGDKDEVAKIMENLKNNKLLSVGIVAAAVFFGLKSCGDGGGTLSNNKETVIQLFATNNITVTPEVAEKALDEMSKRQAATGAKAAVNFLRPAKRRGGSVSLGGKDSGIEIGNETLQLVPEVYEPPEKTESIEELKNTEVDFRALDIDKETSGWAAVIPKVHPEKRIKLELRSNIDRTALLSKKKINADIEVYYRINKDNKTPLKAVVLKVYN